MTLFIHKSSHSSWSRKNSIILVVAKNRFIASNIIKRKLEQMAYKYYEDNIPEDVKKTLFPNIVAEIDLLKGHEAQILYARSSDFNFEEIDGKRNDS